MRVPKAKQLPSGNWFIYLRIGGEKIGITEPTEELCVAKAMAYKSGLIELKRHPENKTLCEACNQYIERNRARLSPTTIAGYEKIVNTAFPDLMTRKLKDITPKMVQRAVDIECGRFSNRGKPYSPKSVKNNYGLISTVLRENDISVSVRLPEIKQKPVLILTPQEIYGAVKGSKVELPVLLAMWLSFSLSEIRGLTKSKSIHNGQISIIDTVVDVHGKPVRKTGGKEYKRTRTLDLPPYLANMIDRVDGDIIVPLSANQITRGFYRRLEDANLPHISFHTLRHINASVMADLGIPEVVANDRGGWKTDYVRKRVYTHAFSDSRKRADNAIDSLFESIIANENVNEMQKV